MIGPMLYDYQRVVPERAVKYRRQAVLDDPGTGKTIMTLASLEADGLFVRPGARILVLATKTGGKLTWLPHADKLLPEDVSVVNAVDGLLAARRKKVAMHATSDKPLLVIANHAFIEIGPKATSFPEMWNIEWDAIVIDESHKVLPSQAGTEADMTQFWRGLWNLKTTPKAIRLALSGTPDRGKLENRFGTWRFLLPEAYGLDVDYEKWVRKNFYVGYRRVKVGHGSRSFFIEQMYPKSLRDPEDWKKMEDLMTIRRTKAEVAAWLPPKSYMDIERELPLKLKQAYEAYEDEFIMNDDGSKNMADTFKVRATQFATCEWKVVGHRGGTTTAEPIPGSASWKRDWILEWLDTRGFLDPDGTARVVITSKYTEILQWLKQELAGSGFSSELLTGSLSTNQRLAVQQDFQSSSGSNRIVLLSMSLGDSIDLDAADDLIFVDEVQDPDITTQTEDRVHRVSRDHHVFIWRLRSLHTVDMMHAKVNEARHHKTRTIYDGRRGVDFARKVLARLR